jgi:hypothetical protein
MPGRDFAGQRNDLVAVGPGIVRADDTNLPLGIGNRANVACALDTASVTADNGIHVRVLRFVKVERLGAPKLDLRIGRIREKATKFTA